MPVPLLTARGRKTWIELDLKNILTELQHAYKHRANPNIQHKNKNFLLGTIVRLVNKEVIGNRSKIDR